jgi:hypothetical protein
MKTWYALMKPLNKNMGIVPAYSFNWSLVTYEAAGRSMHHGMPHLLGKSSIRQPEPL